MSVPLHVTFPGVAVTAIGGGGYGKVARCISACRRGIQTQVVDRPDLGGRVRMVKSGKKRCYRSVVGLEVHAQIAAKSKMFSGAETSSAAPFAPVNSRVSLFDAAVPGTLPALNKRCVEAGILTALALNCRVNLVSRFDRKHYFYADLPAGYQITQQAMPLANDGHLDFNVLKSSTVKKSHSGRVGITQLQLEQDSGKSLHDEERMLSLIDLNRAGSGLMEIVFGPDLFDGEEAASVVKELILIMERLGTCTCRMEEGALRVDANVSVNPSGEWCTLGNRTEVKNLNSIRQVCKAIEYEVERQIELLESGGVVVSETRTFDTESKMTVPMRDKESKRDYRFMPEPNLPPLRLLDDDNGRSTGSRLNVNGIRSGMPELPGETRQRYVDEFGLSLDIASRIVNEPALDEFIAEALAAKVDEPKVLANLVLIALPDILGERLLSETRLKAGHMAELANAKTRRELPHNIILKAMAILCDEEYSTAEDLVSERRYRETSRDVVRIKAEVLEVIDKNPKLVKRYKKGKKDAFLSMQKKLGTKLAEDMDMALVVQVLKQELDQLEES